MRALVTGAAGFIGSHVVDGLLAQGHEVVGVDCFTDYYDPALKRTNLAAAVEDAAFRLSEHDLRSADLTELVDGVDVVYHLAAQAGVRGSWADGFRLYEETNVLATQRLLEAARRGGVRRFVYASSSSVYGNAQRYPTTEEDVPRPFSPYGVTKLAGEHLCVLYAENWGLPTVALRYFTVFGPRQRPEMAMHRLIEAARQGIPFPLFGDGTQVRDFTFVGDVATATIEAGTRPGVEPGGVANVAGGSPATMNDVIAAVEKVAGTSIGLERRPAQPGDVARTGGSTERLEAMLGWSPAHDLHDGLSAQYAWHCSHVAP